MKIANFCSRRRAFFCIYKRSKKKNCIKLKHLYKSIKLNVILVLNEGKNQKKNKQKWQTKAKQNIYQALKTIVFKFNIYITW